MRAATAISILGLSHLVASEEVLGKSIFGHNNLTRELKEAMERVVAYPMLDYFAEHKQQVDIMRRSRKSIAHLKKNAANGEKDYQCNNRFEHPEDPGYFFPVFNGKMNKQNQQVFVTEGRCFKDITFTMDYEGMK